MRGKQRKKRKAPSDQDHADLEMFARLSERERPERKMHNLMKRKETQFMTRTRLHECIEEEMR